MRMDEKKYWAFVGIMCFMALLAVAFGSVGCGIVAGIMFFIYICSLES